MTTAALPSTSGIDPRYRVSINASGPDGPVNVEAWLQDVISVKVQSSWQPFSSASATELTSQIASLVGVSPYSQFSSRRIWKGTSPLKFSLPLKFMALVGGGPGNRSAFDEVERNVRDLLKLASPSQVGKLGILRPPGPSPLRSKWVIGMLNGFRPGMGDSLFSIGQDIITIRIGSGGLLFSPCVVTGVTGNLLPQFDSDGRCVFASCTLDFETYQVCVKSDVDDMFAGKLNNLSDDGG